MSVIVNNVSLRYGKKQILAPLSFEVGAGELVTLFGPSGVGKTSLLKIIAGLQKPSAGTLSFTENFSVADTVLVFQDFWLFPHLTVFENIAFGLKVRRQTKALIQTKVTQIIKRFELIGLEQQYPDQLSGGQKQRVALARALVLQPKLLLLDEPFSSLDSNLRYAMRQYLLDLKAEFGFGIILVTHDQDEAFYLSDRLVVLLDGKVQQIAPPQEIYYRPANQKVAEFIGAMNYLSGTVTGTKFQIGDSRLTVQNPQQLMGSAQLLVPFGTRVTFDGTLPARATKITWRPGGDQVEFVSYGQSFCLEPITAELNVGRMVHLKLPETLQVIPR